MKVDVFVFVETILFFLLDAGCLLFRCIDGGKVSGRAMRPVESVAIIGAGNMGSGIAQKSAQEEFMVQMVDREEKWVERGHSIIAEFLDEAIQRRIFREKEVEDIKNTLGLNSSQNYVKKYSDG